MAERVERVLFVVAVVVVLLLVGADWPQPWPAIDHSPALPMWSADRDGAGGAVAAQRLTEQPAGGHIYLTTPRAKAPLLRRGIMQRLIRLPRRVGSG